MMVVNPMSNRSKLYHIKKSYKVFKKKKHLEIGTAGEKKLKLFPDIILIEQNLLQKID